ncbi:MAG: hypothetical protein AAGG38_07365 [Planctomycetota bacterium]
MPPPQAPPAAPPSKPPEPKITDTEIIAGGGGVVTAYLLKGRPGAAAWAAGDADAYAALPHDAGAWCKRTGNVAQVDHDAKPAQVGRYAAMRVAALREQQGLPQVMPNFPRLGRAVTTEAKRRGSPQAVATLIDTIVGRWPEIAAGLGTYAQTIDLDAAVLLQTRQVIAAADRLAAGQTVTPRTQYPNTPKQETADVLKRDWTW